MKKLLLAGVLFVSPGLFAQALSPSMAKNLDQGREIAGSFGQALKSTLKPALKKQGPVTAVNICQEAAPQLAAKYSANSGWQVGRTSLKVRNPANRADSWERKTLQLFQAQKQQGKPVSQLEHWQVVNQDGQPYFRYMKAIGTAAKPCLACHGSEIKSSIKANLTKHYPQDQATGFKAGDIRGAFTLLKPLN